MSGDLERVIVPIIAGNVVRGYLSVIGAQNTLDTLDHIVAREGALICAVEMFRAKAVRETEKRLQGDLLTALLQDDLSSYDAGLWIEEMGLDQSENHTAMQFAWASPSPPSRRRLETLINGEVARTGARVILNPAGDNVICFFQVSAKTARPDLALALGEKVIDQGHQEYPEHKICCGVGTSVSELNQWQRSLREASQTLQLALRLEESKPLYYPDLSVYRLLMLLENNPELKAFHDDLLGPLFAYENKNAFIETLEAYFANNSNLAHTAKALFIHRNTLSYRLARIQEITQMDLNNADIALALQLAIRIHRVFEK
jgi:purine catabolism regulator